MKVYDFEYDGVRLSDIGYTICSFNGGGLSTISNGSQITFNTVAMWSGEKYELASTRYDECLSTTIQICKNNCADAKEFEITVPQFRALMRWLNRKQFHKLRFPEDEYVGMWYNASFSINRIELEDKLVGLELDVTTDAPFAYAEEREIIINNTEEDGEYRIIDSSDEEGFIYPHMEITLQASGDLSIYNSAEDRETCIANCTEGEVITMDSPIIETTDESHKIQNDFNWNFFRISNVMHDRNNNLTISLPCEIILKYYPIVKMGLL